MSQRTFRYLERGVERFVEHRAAEGSQDSPSQQVVAVATGTSAAVREYQDKLRAIELHRRGVAKVEVANTLGRSPHWVARWWKQTPELLSRPHGAQDSVFRRAPLMGFRDVEIRRGFFPESALCDELTQTIPWKQGKVMHRDDLTCELVLRFNEQGQTIPAKRMCADYAGGVKQLDALLQKAFCEANIRDPQARVVMNLYADGQKSLNAHRHDYWTCLISLGSPRILTVDHTPVVLEDGDMIVFGTQLHGVPEMLDVTGPRISIVIFYYPDRDNLERRWLTITAQGEEQHDDEECSSCALYGDAPPKKLAALHSALDPSASRREGWRKSNEELQYGIRPKLPMASLYSLGCGWILASDLCRLLAGHQVTEIWDLRAPEDIKLAIRSDECAEHLRPEALQELFLGRIRYRTWPIGTRAAGGLVHHLHATEEGPCMIWRLHESAYKNKVCFLGFKETWQEDDLRISIASALQASGAQVMHLGPGETMELHPSEYELPIRLKPSEPKVPEPKESAADISRASALQISDDESGIAETLKGSRPAGTPEASTDQMHMGSVCSEPDFVVAEITHLQEACPASTEGRWRRAASCAQQPSNGRWNRSRALLRS